MNIIADLTGKSILYFICFFREGEGVTVHIGLRTCCADRMLNWASEQKSHRQRRFSWIFARCCEHVNSNGRGFALYFKRFGRNRGKGRGFLWWEEIGEKANNV